MTTERTYQTIEIVCIGARLGTGDKLIIGVMPAVLVGDGDGTIADQMATYWPANVAKKYVTGTPGAVYTADVELVDGKVNTFKNIKYGRPLENKVAIAYWEARQAAAVTADRAKKAEAKLKADTKLDALFGPIAEVLAKLPWQDQAAFENFMVARVRYLARKKG